MIPGHPEGVGIVGYWHHEWQGEPALEAAGRSRPSTAGRASPRPRRRALLDAARAAGETLPVHAYPRVDNPASNAVCRKAGFRLLGAGDFEVAPGRVLHTNDWVAELAPPTGPQPPPSA